METKDISTDDFFWARDYVSSLLGQSSNTQKPTRDRQAEVLLRRGIVDIKKVLAQKPVTTDEVDRFGKTQEEQENA